MQRAGHKRSASTRAIPATPSVHTLNVVGFDDKTDSAPSVDIELLPTVTAIARIRSAESLDRNALDRALEAAIQQRIESRLLGRVRNLNVRVTDGVVVLEGECSTFYTKQIAQHTAMGILEDEHLENSIVVRVS